MIDNKINKLKNLIKKINNDITLQVLSSFLEWFYWKVNIHFNKKISTYNFKKWQIFYVNLWHNIWSELNKTRPCLIYSTEKCNWWNNVIVIPFKSYKLELNNKINVLVKPSDYNLLIKDCYLSVTDIKSVSKKRILWKIWKIENKHLMAIDSKVVRIFWIKKEQVFTCSK